LNLLRERVHVGGEPTIHEIEIPVPGDRRRLVENFRQARHHGHEAVGRDLVHENCHVPRLLHNVFRYSTRRSLLLSIGALKPMEIAASRSAMERKVATIFQAVLEPRSSSVTAMVDEGGPPSFF